MATTLSGFRSLKPLDRISGSWDSFNGYSEELKREVQLAIVRADALREEAVRKKFAEVAKVVSALQHPMLQRCLMAVPLPDGRWSVMSEPVEGPTLHQVLDEQGALACDDAVQLVMLLCEAVDAAHQRGVVHGDIAPHHVQLPGGLHAFKPKLTGMALGMLRSPGASAYAAPELQAGRDASPLADVYSLGAVLYACLTGKPPTAADVEQLAPLPPGTEHLWPVVKKCLSKDFTKRYFAAGELAKALHNANGTLVPPSQVVGTEPMAPMPAGDASDTLSPDLSLGPYQLVKLLGEGSMGQVYLGRHKALGRQVAIKVLRPEQYRRGDLIQRFFQEARTVNQINHEHIVEIFDFVQEPGPDGPSAVYCVMELLQGTSLTGAIEKAPVQLKRSLHIVRQICDALFAAHKVGVVHRDVKPDNIFLIERAGQKDYVKVLDFGVAKLTHAQPDAPLISTMDGAIIGTPMCMAPEQASGGAVDYRADIYAVGVILYLLLSGRLPFDAKNFATLAVQLITQPPPPLPDKTPSGEQLDPGLKAIVLKCLEKNPDHRPKSMRELGEALVPYMSMSTIRASEPGIRPVAPQMNPVPAEKRSPAMWVAVAAVVLAAAGAGLLMLKPWARVETPPVAMVEPPKPPPEPPKPPEPPEPPPVVKDDPPPVVDATPPNPTPTPPKPLPSKPVKLTPQLIQEVVVKKGEVKRCLDRHRTDLKEQQGQVTVSMTVEPSGEVKNPAVVTPGLGGTGLEGCVLKEVKRMRFPKIIGSAASFKVNFTYSFK
jgi:eukaryotic-like serine/threonine-protein kinase